MRSTYEQSKLKLDSLKRYVDNLDTLNWVILQYSQGMFDGKPTTYIGINMCNSNTLNIVSHNSMESYYVLYKYEYYLW